MYYNLWDESDKFRDKWCCENIIKDYDSSRRKKAERNLLLLFFVYIRKGRTESMMCEYNWLWWWFRRR